MLTMVAISNQLARFPLFSIHFFNYSQISILSFRRDAFAISLHELFLIGFLIYIFKESKTGRVSMRFTKRSITALKLKNSFEPWPLEIASGNSRFLLTDLTGDCWQIWVHLGPYLNISNIQWRFSNYSAKNLVLGLIYAPQRDLG